MKPFKRVRPVPCQHIADYYTACWTANKQLGTNLLRRGYGQWAAGLIERGCNNLFGGKKQYT
jgi:hypothetical protein